MKRYSLAVKIAQSRSNKKGIGWNLGGDEGIYLEKSYFLSVNRM